MLKNIHDLLDKNPFYIIYIRKEHFYNHQLCGKSKNFIISYKYDTAM